MKNVFHVAVRSPPSFHPYVGLANGVVFDPAYVRRPGSQSAEDLLFEGFFQPGEKYLIVTVETEKTVGQLVNLLMRYQEIDLWGMSVCRIIYPFIIDESRVDQLFTGLKESPVIYR